MNRKIYTAAAMILGGLVVGATVEHIRVVNKTTPPVTSPEPEVVHHVRKVARKADAGTDKLQEALIASLKARLAAQNAELEELRAASQPQITEVAVKTDGESKRESWSERIERMKTEDPEKYAEMQKRRDDFKERITQRSQDRRTFLADISVEGMNEEQRANHTRLVELTDKIDGIMQQLVSGKAENSREMRHTMFESVGELGELYANEREYLLQQTAAAVGYEGDEAALFTTHVRDIIENTTLQPMMGGMHGRGRGK